LSDNRQVVRTTGGSHQVISTEQIDYQIAQYGIVSDAIGYSMVFEGHPWYSLTFPGAEETWCYDARTDLWHKLSSYDKTEAPYKQGRHRGASYAYFDGKHLIGDYANGLIYQTLSNYYTDYNRPIVSIGVGRFAQSDRRIIAFKKFEIEFEPGVGNEYEYNVDDDGNYTFNADGTYAVGTADTVPNPKASVDWTDDGGHTWSSPRIVNINKIGDYDRAQPIYQLGSSRNRAFRIKITDPVKRVIVAAYTDVSVSKD
jgi:hypothetical protein